MKKLVSLLLVFLLFPAFASAVLPDLSGLTYDELVQLKSMINHEIWQREEWQEVTVPQGVWIVGEDIPAGTWTVKCSPNYNSVFFEWGDTLKPNGQSIDVRSERFDYLVIFNPDSPDHIEGSRVSYTFTVYDGEYIVVSTAPVVFMPYHGKPILSFK